MLRQASGLSLFLVFSVLSVGRLPVRLGYMRDPCHLFQMYGASLACTLGTTATAAAVDTTICHSFADCGATCRAHTKRGGERGK